MQNAMWLASIFGPLLVILGVWMLFYRDNMMKVYSSIKATPGVLYVMGVMNLFVGLVSVNIYSVWAGDMMLLVTLFGWLLLLQGVGMFFFPQFVLKQKARAKKFSIRGVIALVWGLLLCWSAFGMQ